eukprot:801096-Prorocentrum_minimum.AAC.1
MDDDHDTIPGVVSYRSATAHFTRKLAYFKELGIEESEKKGILPAKQAQVLHWLRGGQRAADGYRRDGQAGQGGQQLLTEAYRSRDAKLLSTALPPWIGGTPRTWWSQTGHCRTSESCEIFYGTLGEATTWTDCPPRTASTPGTRRRAWTSFRAPTPRMQTSPCTSPTQRAQREAVIGKRTVLLRGIQRSCVPPTPAATTGRPLSP